MDWVDFPLELFAYVIVDLEAESIVKLERVCKSWRENLKNQSIWKEIALRNFPSYKAKDIQNWRDVALTRFIVGRNMREKKCLSRMIVNNEYLDTSYRNILMHSCSVAGSEALITLIDEELNYSYSTTRFISYELVDLITGERQKLAYSIAQPHALLTENYIITSTVPHVMHQTIYGGEELEVTDRLSGDIFTIKIDDLKSKRAVMQQNEDAKFDSICLCFNADLYVVDLKKQSWRKFTAQNMPVDSSLQFQLYGQYLAYGRTTRLRGLGELSLTVIDTETGKQIFTEKTQMLDWAISNNKVFFGHLSEPDSLQWVLKNFNGDVLKQYNVPSKLTHIYQQSSVRLFEHVIAYFKRMQLFFFDIHSGEFLCSLDVVGAAEYGTPPYLRSISPGKFIVSQKKWTRLIDFESRFITKPVKMSVVSPVGAANTVPEHLRTALVPFNTIIDFAKEISQSKPDDLSYFSSICVQQTQDKRKSMIFASLKPKKDDPESTLKANATATKLFASKIRVYSHTNILPTRFTEDDKVLTNISANSHIKHGDVIYDHVVMYQEAFMNGEWVPVDYEEDI